MPVMELDPSFAPQRPHPGLEALEDSFCMVDVRWRVTYWNAAAARALGLPRERTLGRPLWNILPFLRHPAAAEHLQRVHAERIPLRFLASYDANGRGCASVRAAPLPDGGLALDFRDATEEVRRAE